MPEKHPSSHPSHRVTLVDAARLGMVLTVKCGLYGRVVRYWAADLVERLGLKHDVQRPPFACSRCRSGDFMSVRWHVPAASEMAAGFIVRRPVRQVTKWVWRDERA